MEFTFLNDELYNYNAVKSKRPFLSKPCRLFLSSFSVHLRNPSLMFKKKGPWLCQISFLDIILVFHVFYF
jgi:hypothetical protein